MARPSIPGGWLWALWVVLAHLDNIESSVDRDSVINEVKNFFGGELTWHTDTHQKNPEDHCQGCGHAQRLITQWNRYQLSQASSELLKRESNLISGNKLDSLDWEHEERNVFIVDIPGKGIVASWELWQDFVYNVAYANDLYSQISERLSEKLWLTLDVPAIQKVAENHFMTTWGDLAAWRDVFLVTDVDTDNVPEIEYLMTV